MTSSSQRLDGFELLHLIGAPVPAYQVIRSPNDIDTIRTWQVRHGWSIRSCRLDGVREMGLFYDNYVPAACLREVLKDAFRSSSKLFFLVYPSWRFRFSCNIVAADCEVLVEGKYGSQKGISMGTDSVDFSLRMPFGFRSLTEILAGHICGEVESRLGQLIYYVRKSMLPHAYAEAALKEDGDLVFYDLFDLDRTPHFSINPAKVRGFV